jgi:hypothetical protein
MPEISFAKPKKTSKSQKMRLVNCNFTQAKQKPYLLKDSTSTLDS